jgi:hypothetical protein
MKTEEGAVSRLASKKIIFSLLGIIVALVIGLSMAFMSKKIDSSFLLKKIKEPYCSPL